MAHIIIKNVGPIKDVELDLNKINVFMGPQSSGKSTIAKIISFCSWFEKNAIVNGLQKDFYKQLIEYHNLEESYFCDNSFIEYKTEFCQITFSGNNEKNLNIKVNVGQGNVYKNKKICYVPAERNFVTIPGIGKYNQTRDNVMGFLYDWFESKQGGTSDALSFPKRIFNIDKFFYNKEDDTDYVVLSNGIQIGLRHTASGLISAIPMLVVFDYFVRKLHSRIVFHSPYNIMQRQARIERLTNADRQKIKSKLDGVLALTEDKDLEDILGFDFKYNSSEIIIEEPELNLFPNTQFDILYYMLSCLQWHEHQMILTTHSPYILFAINNCMLGGLVEKKIPEQERYQFDSHEAWIDPKKVSIYEIHDGKLRCIQDEDGIIEDNYLNQAYKENSAEYLSLLNYYDDEE